MRTGWRRPTTRRWAGSSTLLAASAWTATTWSGMSCTKTCCGSSAALDRSDMKPSYLLLDGSSLPSKEEIGGKAWSLARMQQLGLPCPPAFVLPTHVCHAYNDSGAELSPEVEEALHLGIIHLEESSRRSFGRGSRPLLVSVRSGAPVSMPGMMDTVLNLGIDAAVEEALAAESSDAGFARDTHRRFVLSYGRIVLKADLDDETATPDQLRVSAMAE